MFERILVPLDGSTRAELILPQVGGILRRGDSEILLLRAVNIPESIGRANLLRSSEVPLLLIRTPAREKQAEHSPETRVQIHG